MFEQKPPKIKEAIFDFLRGIDYKKESEIVDNVKYLTKGYTPERSINRTLNELAKQKYLSKAYFVNGSFYPWKKELDHSRTTRYYKLIYEYTRKMISTVMYAGSNTQSNSYTTNTTAKTNPNHLLQPEWKSPRKTPSDLKAWTYDRPKDKDVNRKTWLCEHLLSALKNSGENAWFPQVEEELNPRTTRTGHTDKGISATDLEEAVDSDGKILGRYLTFNKERFGYDDSQTKAQVNSDEIYKNFKWSIRGVEQ